MFKVNKINRLETIISHLITISDIMDKTQELINDIKVENLEDDCYNIRIKIEELKEDCLTKYDKL